MSPLKLALGIIVVAAFAYGEISDLMRARYVEINGADELNTIQLQDNKHYIICYVGLYKYIIKQSAKVLDDMGNGDWLNLLNKTFSYNTDIYLEDHTFGFLILSNDMNYYIYIDRMNRFLHYDYEKCEFHEGIFVPRRSN